MARPGRLRIALNNLAGVRSRAQVRGVVSEKRILRHVQIPLLGFANTRARMMDGLNPENVEKVAQSLGMKIVFGPMHLDPSHRSLAIIEAPAIEAVTKWVIETGMFQWNTVEVCPVTPIEEMMPIILESPPIFD